MKRTRLLLVILGISAGLVIGYYWYATYTSGPWVGLSCEEMYEFTSSPEHQRLTMDEHMEFHEYYNPCIPDT